MIPYLEFVLSQVPKSGPGAPKLVQLQAVRDLVLLLENQPLLGIHEGGMPLHQRDEL